MRPSAYGFISTPKPNMESSDANFWGVISVQPSVFAASSASRWPLGASNHTSPFSPGLDSVGGSGHCLLFLNLPAFFPRMTWLRMNRRVCASGLASDVVVIKGSPSVGWSVPTRNARGPEANVLPIMDAIEASTAPSSSAFGVPDVPATARQFGLRSTCRLTP
jgi:hypothetical protein